MILHFHPRPAGQDRPAAPGRAPSIALDVGRAFEHPSGMEASDLMSTAAVCRAYGVTRQTVRLWVADGLPLAPETLADPATGRPVRLWFRAAEVAAYLEARKNRPRASRGPDKAPRKRRGQAATSEAADAA